MDGLWIYWYVSGQKKFERNFKDGKRDGDIITWSDDSGEGWIIRGAGNGRKKVKETWKDGKLIDESNWEWNEINKWVEIES